MSPDHITAGAYNQNINKPQARIMVWPRQTSLKVDTCDHLDMFPQSIVNSCTIHFIAYSYASLYISSTPHAVTLA